MWDNGGGGGGASIGNDSIIELIDIDKEMQQNKQQNYNILNTFNHTMWSRLCHCNLS